MASLKNYRDLEIDWTMTPEDAVTMYLEWGNNGWKGDRQPVRSKSDYSNYFVVYNWDERPRAILIRRNSEEAQELATLDLPGSLAQKFLDKVGGFKGVYAPTPEVRAWLKEQLQN
ncbi:MAG: DVU0772 family protein [Desulfovibrionaceae bacterium]